MFTLTIDTGNDAFVDSATELARILRKAADTLTASGLPAPDSSGALRDVNGNTVGRWELS